MLLARLIAAFAMVGIAPWAAADLFEGALPLISVITEKHLPIPGDAYNTPEYYALATSYSVGLVSVKDGTGKSLGSGSGTLVAADWVMTAAHVVETPAATATFKIGGTTYDSASLHVPAEWYTIEGYDIALIKLTKSVTGYTPATVYGMSALGYEGTHVGYGTFGTGAAGEIAYDAKLRAANNMIDAVTATGDWYRTDFDKPGDTTGTYSTIGSATALPLEGMITHGDSGGGLFASIGGKSYLVGVHSYGGYGTDGAKTFSSYGSEGGSTQVYKHLAWLEATAGVGTIAVVPEPSSLILLGLALCNCSWISVRTARQSRSRNPDLQQTS